MTAPTPEERAAWRELASKATPGPWQARTQSVWADRKMVAGSTDGANAAFAATARDAMPRLLDALDAAEAERDMALASSNPADLAENLRLRAEVERLRHPDLRIVYGYEAGAADLEAAEARAEKAEAAIARVRALCDERENSPARGVMFGGDPMPAIVSTDEVRAALDGGDHE